MLLWLKLLFLKLLLLFLKLLLLLLLLLLSLLLLIMIMIGISLNIFLLTTIIGWIFQTNAILCLSFGLFRLFSLVKHPREFSKDQQTRNHPKKDEKGNLPA